MKFLGPPRPERVLLRRNTLWRFVNFVFFVCVYVYAYAYVQSYVQVYVKIP